MSPQEMLIGLEEIGSHFLTQIEQAQESGSAEDAFRASETKCFLMEAIFQVLCVVPHSQRAQFFQQLSMVLRAGFNPETEQIIRQVRNSLSHLSQG